MLRLSTQCARTDLNKRSLPKPTITAGWKHIPHRSKISMNWNPPRPGGSHYIFQIFFRLTIFFSGKKKLSPRNNFCLVLYVLKSKKKFGVIQNFLKISIVSLKKIGRFQFMLILDLWCISFHPAVVVGLGNDLLF